MTVLETSRLLFREHAPGDLEPYCAMEADPEVRRYVGGSPRSRLDAERKFREVHLSRPSGLLALWATDLKESGSYIGYCGIYPHFGPDGPVPAEGALAFYLARAAWGRGLATEAGRAFLGFGFGSLALRRIVAKIDVRNDRSRRVLEKLDFRSVGIEVRRDRSFERFELFARLRTDDGGRNKQAGDLPRDVAGVDTEGDPT